MLRLAGAGVLVGIPMAILLARLLRSQLFGVTPADPFVLTAAVCIVGAVALGATLLPARKAASVDEATARSSHDARRRP